MLFLNYDQHTHPSFSTRFGRSKPQHMHNINLTVFLKLSIICLIKIILYSIVSIGTVIGVACWTCGFLRYKRIGSRNTSFSIHVLKQKSFHTLISCRYFFFDISLHDILWQNKHHDDSPCQNVLVGVPCGPSSFNLANVECVAIGECSKNV